MMSTSTQLNKTGTSLKYRYKKKAKKDCLKRGRKKHTPEEKSVVKSISLPPELVEKIEAYALAHGLKFNAAARELLESALLFS